MNIEKVILVNSNDEPIGTMEKLEAHQKGELHRAFSVFIFNTQGELLLQRRALDKYHSSGLWTNTCCSHPRPGEDTKEAAERRLKEEMGLETPLKFRSVFIYKTQFDNSLTEHEVDHVFVGVSDTQPKINPEEVDSYCWKSIEELKKEIKTDPKQFTSWFIIAMEKLF